MPRAKLGVFDFLNAKPLIYAIEKNKIPHNFELNVKILLAYFSFTGNTEKVSKLIFKMSSGKWNQL